MDSLNTLPENWRKKGKTTEDKGQRKKNTWKHRKEKISFWIGMSETILNKSSTESILKQEFYLILIQFCEDMHTKIFPPSAF